MLWWWFSGYSEAYIEISNSYTSVIHVNVTQGGLVSNVADGGTISNSYWVNISSDGVNNCVYSGSYTDNGCTAVSSINQIPIR